MDAFLNGYLATVLLNASEECEKIRDLVHCCDAQSVELDPRIERALCLRQLSSRVKAKIFNRGTLVLARKVLPPGADGSHWSLHAGLRTQVFLNERGFGLENIFEPHEPTDTDVGEGWMNCLLVRKRYLSRILDQCFGKSESEIRAAFEKAFPLASVVSRLELCLEIEIEETRRQLEDLQIESSSVIKQKKVCNDYLTLLSPAGESEDCENWTYKGSFITVDELVRRVVEEGEDIHIPKILPERFRKVADIARKRIEEYQREQEVKKALEKVRDQLGVLESHTKASSEKLDALVTKVNDLAQQLVSLSPPQQRQVGGNSSNDVDDGDQLQRYRQALYSQFEKVLKELAKNKEATCDVSAHSFRTPQPVMTSAARENEHVRKSLCVSANATPWKRKTNKRTSQPGWPDGGYPSIDLTEIDPLHHSEKKHKNGNYP